MSSQILQQFKGHSIRIVDVNGQPHFVLADVCAVLGVKNTTQAARRLDDDERLMLNIGPQGNTWTINESGLYALILRSDKPVAREFRKWVTNEVLPALRQTGRYEVSPTYATPAPALDLSALQQMADLIPVAIKNEVAQAKTEIREEVAAVAQQLDSKIGSLPITSEQIRTVKDLINGIVSRRKELGFANWHWGKVYNEAWAACGVGNLTSMTRAQFPKVVEYLTAELTALRVMNPANMLFSESTAGRA